MRFIFLSGFLILTACGAKPSSSKLNGIGACKSGHMVNQCLNQNACRVACTAGGTVAGAATSGGLGAAVGVSTGAAVCSELCGAVPECADVFVCDEYEIGGP